MKAARKPGAAAGLLLAAMVGSVGLGFVMGSCQMVGGGARSTAPIERRAEAEAPAADVHRVAGLTGEPDMRVRIGAAVPKAVFEGVDGFWIGPVGEHASAELVRAPVQMSLGAAGWSARDAAGKERTWPGDRDLELMPVTDKGAVATMNGVKYAGTFRLISSWSASATASATRGSGAVASGVLGAMQPAGVGGAGAGEAGGGAERVAFDVIEHVKIEDYLPGVIAKELYQSWSLETFKTQAITARSYAIHERQRSLAAGRKFDVESTTQDQAYGGATVLPVAVQAVAETRGQVLEFGGAVLRAYYSSTCGGRAASARDTWQTNRGYEFNLAAPIQGKDRPFACEGSPLFRWTVERPKDELVKRLAEYGRKNGYMVRQIKDLAKVEVLRVNETGRPAEYKVIEPGGKWYPLKAEELRLACNTDYPGPPASPAITRQTRINSGDLEFAVKGSTVTISGRGFGHGVGMCQYCTQALTSKGEAAVALLERFYPGARVVRAY